VVGSDIAKRMIEVYDAGGRITMCAWCGRVEFDSEWLTPPPATLPEIDAPNTLSHSICPKCAALPDLLGPQLPDPQSDPCVNVQQPGLRAVV
jgi:hypothetical protein